MFLVIIGLILPPVSILLLGILLVLIPQHYAVKHYRTLQRLIRPGNTVRTTLGLKGMILSTTQTHVIMVCDDGSKHEILRSLIVAMAESTP